MMAVRRIDASGWHKRNLWRHSSGELAVRPGMRRIYTPDTGRTLVGGFSVQNSYVPEVWHYVFDVATTGARDLRLRILDETFQVFAIFVVGTNVVPRVITHCVIEGQIAIGSPDFPPLFGIVGSSVIFARKVTSISGLTTIEMPRGIVVGINNRACFFDGRSMFVTDPVSIQGGDLRAILAQNQNARPGVVYGAHEGENGSLVVVTSVGTYGLGSDAFAVGIVGSNGTPWRLLNHAAAFSYCSSCSVRGRIYALTQDGYTIVDTDTKQETILSDPIMPRYFGERVSAEDYRTARMYASDVGPLVALDTLDSVHRTDVTAGMSTWWSSEHTSFRLRGVLKTLEGTDLLLTEIGVFEVVGDFDGELSTTSQLALTTGVLFGVELLPPDDPLQVRGVYVAAAVDGGAGGPLVGSAVRGSGKTSGFEADRSAMTIGASDFGSGTKRWLTTPIQVSRHEYGDERQGPTVDLGLEVSAQGCGSRIHSTISIDGPDSERRTGRSA